MSHERVIDWRKPIIPNIIGIMAIHILALGVLIPELFSWSGLTWFFVLYLVSGFGITMGYHRLLTHESFKTPRWMLYFITVCGSLAWQGSPITWVKVHRRHHQYSDQEKDPHSPMHGFDWAHMLWPLFRSKHAFDLSSMSIKLEKDPIFRLIDRFHWAPQVILTGVLYLTGYLIGGHALALSWIVWGIGLRTATVYHSTWFVNSWCHVSFWRINYRNFDTKDNSRNSAIVAVLALGEGNHNNHHDQPRSAAHGMRWFEFDPTYWVIVILSWFGLATKIRKPDLSKMKK